MKMLKLWPGLIPFYHYGSVWGWFLAMFFAWFAIVVVCGTLMWSEWIPAASHGTLWLILGVTWFLGVLISHQHETILRDTEAANEKKALAEDTLPLAQTAYLRRDFYEAERLLQERLQKFPEDVPARLLWVSVLRQQNRVADALAQLTLLETAYPAGKWLFEVRRERTLLE